ncbi:glycosyl hydrolase family 18 protein [Sphingomonas gilva]|uniref:glycosyl hydrolase family 18 protein n=1 Tax=Sphingomonas gilva TaxID=2305907 RepID=UPI0015FADAA4|nr:glycosyl hydrolase family 18 protein [Sphingomonas gilva]
MRILNLGLGAVLLLGAAAQAQPSQPVWVGYLPVFRGLETVTARADMTHYTHINLAFANPAPDGRIVDGDAMACMEGGAQGDVTLAELDAAIGRVKAAGAKALLSLGGGTIPGCSGDWAELLAPERRPAVVRNLVALVDAHGLDGIDVDIEGALLTAIDKAGNYTPFIAELGAAMRARGKLLTCATASYQGGMIPRSSVPWFDLVNVMSYDAIGPSWGSPGAEHSTFEQAQRDLALWRERGVAREKLVLGVPFYGYGFGGYRPNHAYRDILAEHGPAAANDVIGERCAGCSYVTHNGPATLARKAALAQAEAAGVMVWEITQDTDDAALIRAMRAAFARAAQPDNTNSSPID